jgi:uncharacterized membrane protein required for colicin V production
MTVYDGVMALIVFFTVVHGFWRGAVWQVAPIMSLVLGYMVAMPMSVTTAQYFGPPPTNRLFALVTIYILVSMVVYLTVRSFREGIDKAKLTEFDRHLGAILGGVKGVLVTLSATCILLIYFPMTRDMILKSESSTIAAQLISRIYPILPLAMHNILDPYLKQLDQIGFETDDGFQGSNGKTSPRPINDPPLPPVAPPGPNGNLPYPQLQPTSPALADDYQPPVRRQIRSSPLSLEPTTTEPPPPRPRPPIRSAQEDDPFEAADPDRAISPLR